jgi:hypothetical protein
MNRKDGTTKVFKMFLGDVIHKVERKAEHNVQVRAVTYQCNDAEFNETTLDWQGKVQYSTMISKLSAFSSRTEFIIRLLTDFIQVDGVSKEIMDNHKKQMDAEKPPCERCGGTANYLVHNTCCNVVKYCLICMQETEMYMATDKDGNLVRAYRPIKCPNCKKRSKYEQHFVANPYIKPLEQLHIIVLAQNLDILHYIYNKMVCKNLAPVGYYVGGMKQQDLKKSEQKQIVLATYSMASEALDIPSLNAEFLITPKTDIEQSVGRILRAKHAFADPIIYDIRDAHDVFMKQWRKRKAFYKKHQYQIIECNSKTYSLQLFNDCNSKSEDNDDFSEEEEGDEDEEDDGEEEKEQSLNKNKTIKGQCLLKALVKKDIITNI